MPGVGIKLLSVRQVEERLSLFVCPPEGYSHADKKQINDLLDHLNYLKFAEEFKYDNPEPLGVGIFASWNDEKK
jgi:hypothetical protein